MIDLLRALYKNQAATVRTPCGNSEWFDVGQGVRQGCIASPLLFNIYAERVMRIVLEGFVGGIEIGGQVVNNIRYADDTTLLANSQAELQDLIERVRIASKMRVYFSTLRKPRSWLALMVVSRN